MANYYLSGYTPPSSVTSKDQVAALQRQLGVTADGVWGPKTQAAYNTANGVKTSSVPSGFASAFQDSLAMLQGYMPQISYSPTSEATLRSNISSYLRPAVEQAIANRQKQTVTNKANLDADAYARGMGSSTWLTDVKNRQQNAEGSDIATMESNYGATLAQQIAEAMAREQQNSLVAQQFNASAQQAALSQALSMANGFYSQSLANTGKKSSGSSSSMQKYIDTLLAALEEQSTPTTPVKKAGAVGGSGKMVAMTQ